MSETVWTQYAVDMLDGRFEWNSADAIVIAADGRLLNGQHRLRACVEAKVSFESSVAFNVNPKGMRVIDGGHKRTAANKAGLDGLANSSAACAIASFLVVHERFGIQRINNPKCKATQTQIVERAFDPLIQDAIVAARTLIGLGSLTVAGFCFYLFTKQDPELAAKFFNQLSAGDMLGATSPILLLREKLRALAVSKAKLPKLYLIALYFRAWVSYRDGKTMRLLRVWRTDGPNPEAFPDISFGGKG